MTTTDTEVVAAETEREKGVCLCKQETRGGLFQSHRQDASCERTRATLVPADTMPMMLAARSAILG